MARSKEFNPFRAGNLPDTLNQCAAVARFMGDALTDDQECSPDDQSRFGAFLIMNALVNALETARDEASKVHRLSVVGGNNG